MTFLYFAYGYNMLPARLLGRCPSAKVVRTGVVSYPPTLGQIFA